MKYAVEQLRVLLFADRELASGNMFLNRALPETTCWEMQVVIVKAWPLQQRMEHEKIVFLNV